MPDSQTLGLFIAAMIAGVICFRLYTVLGRRTGHEAPPQPAPTPLAQPAPPQPKQDGEAPQSSGGLLDIQLADRNFDTPKFVEGAREAYGLIVNAFARGDREALRPLLSPEVLSAFEAEIAARGVTVPATFSRLADARIVGASLDGRLAEITVAFTAEFSTGTVTDVWTFARSLDAADPNWILVATSGDLP